MTRTLDLTAMRAVITVADCGSVTRAAEFLNLTQSAVSMQIKRLEESLGRALFDRSQRKMTLSASGERLVSYGRKMLSLNDDALSALGLLDDREQLVLGLPHDIVAPYMPEILRNIATVWPQLQLNLVVDFSRNLLSRFSAGEMDLILTTETRPGPQGEALGQRRLVWVGRPEMAVQPDKPVPLALGKTCIFRPTAVEALEKAGIAGTEVLDGDSDTVIDASVAAGMAVTVRLEGKEIDGCVALTPDSGLPELGRTTICLYHRDGLRSDAALALLAELRRVYGS